VDAKLRSKRGELTFTDKVRAGLLDVQTMVNLGLEVKGYRHHHNCSGRGRFCPFHLALVLQKYDLETRKVMKRLIIERLESMEMDTSVEEVELKQLKLGVTIGTLEAEMDAFGSRMFYLQVERPLSVLAKAMITHLGNIEP